MSLGILFDADNKRELTFEDYNRSRVPKRLWEVSLNSIPETAPYKKAVSWYIQNLAEEVRKGTGLIFTGEHGGGKTASSVLILLEVMARGGSALFLEENSLVGAVLQKEQFNYDYSVLERCQNVDCLAIDDLGLSPHTENLHVTETLVKYRIHRQKSTIITTNLTKDDFKTRYMTIADALREVSIPVVCEGVSWRDKRASELHERFREGSKDM